MATQAQILANRRNAQKSTGPRTAEGKAAVAKNAIKHGLFARQNVVISEDQAAFDALREEMLAELAPEGVMESLLAARIVSLTWRLQRAERMQNELIDVKIRREINDTFPELSESLITGKPCDMSKYSDKCYDDQALGYIAMGDFAGARALERLSMYERRFEASLFKTMTEFKKLRRARRAKEAEEVKKAPDPFFGDPLEKQSQSAAAQNELSAFEKREYELLIGTPPRPNKANDPHGKSEDRGQKTEGRGRMTEKRRRRDTLPFDKLRAGVCRY